MRLAPDFHVGYTPIECPHVSPHSGTYLWNDKPRVGAASAKVQTLISLQLKLWQDNAMPPKERRPFIKPMSAPKASSLRGNIHYGANET